MFDRREFIRTGGLASAAVIGGNSFLRNIASGVEAPIVATPGLIVHTETPRNSEPTLDQLVKSWITPNENFYVRSHAPVPEIDVNTFRLSIEGMVDRPFSVTLEQLQREFTKRSVIATLTCAGNRRNEHSLTKQVSGVPWQSGAIGNASWGGVQLSDLLKNAGIQAGAKHVWFEGVDQVERSNGIIPFGASIPMAKAMSDTESMPGALVAYEMNEQPLSPDHGYPMRTVVPGFIGARSVKWLGKIIVSDKPSTNHYVATAYKLVDESTPEKWAAASPIDHFVLNAAICKPSPGAKLTPGEIAVTGYALPPGLSGRSLRKVEISTDNGKTWVAAKFDSKAKPFCWQLWRARVAINQDVETLIARATDSEGTTQPESVAWNLKGYLFNAWYRTPIDVTP